MDTGAGGVEFCQLGLARVESMWMLHLPSSSCPGWMYGWMGGWRQVMDLSTTTSSLLFTKFSGHCLTWPINEASSSLFRIGSYTGKRIMWEPIRDRRV